MFEHIKIPHTCDMKIFVLIALGLYGAEAAQKTVGNISKNLVKSVCKELTKAGKKNADNGNNPPSGLLADFIFHVADMTTTTRDQFRAIRAEVTLGDIKWCKDDSLSTLTSISVGLVAIDDNTDRAVLGAQLSCPTGETCALVFDETVIMTIIATFSSDPVQQQLVFDQFEQALAEGSSTFTGVTSQATRKLDSKKTVGKVSKDLVKTVCKELTKAGKKNASNGNNSSFGLLADFIFHVADMTSTTQDQFRAIRAEVTLGDIKFCKDDSLSTLTSVSVGLTASDDNTTRAVLAAQLSCPIGDTCSLVFDEAVIKSIIANFSSDPAQQQFVFDQFEQALAEGSTTFTGVTQTRKLEAVAKADAVPVFDAGRMSGVKEGPIASGTASTAADAHMSRYPKHIGLIPDGSRRNGKIHGLDFPRAVPYCGTQSPRFFVLV